MVIPQVPSNIKMRRCGYCMVKVGIRNTLEEDEMSDVQAYIFLAPSLFSCCYRCFSALSLLLTAQWFEGMADLINSVKGSHCC